MSQKMMRLAVVSLLVLIVSSEVEPARILAVTPIVANSHQIVIKSILHTLASAGHELVVYSPFRSAPRPNYTDVYLDLKTSGENIDNLILGMMSNPYWKCYDNVAVVHETMFWGDSIFGNDEIKKLLQSDEKFDLVITESFVGQEILLIFGQKFKVPVIGIQTCHANFVLNMHMGNALSIASVPDMCAPFTSKMNFAERAINAFSIIRGLYIHYNWYIPLLESKIRKILPDFPPVLDLTQSVSLMFINDHALMDYAQPRPSTMIPVAGIHIAPPKDLPEDIKTFMDEASEGVILFSLGTYVPDEMQPKEYFDMYINVFKRLSQRVLWKTRKNHIEGLPDNVMVKQWWPQQDILAHPNCVLFITHGGRGGQLETIWSGVPVVGIPYLTDQHRNVAFYVDREVGVRVLAEDISEQTMSAAIQTVLDNPKYRENMKKLSQIFRDQPMSPQQSVVYWTEYVIRHGGAPHLKPSSTSLWLYQLALLDVLAAILAVVLTAAAASYLIIRKILSVIRERTKTISATKKRN